MLKLENIIELRNWGDYRKVINPKFPNKIYRARRLAIYIHDSPDKGDLYVQLEEIDDNEHIVGNDILVELNKFVNTFEHYIPKEIEVK